MPHLYVSESDVKLGVRENQLVVTKIDDGSVRRIPFGEVEDISIYGCAQLSTQLIRTCISSNVPIAYYAENGSYFGCLTSSTHADPVRQKAQILLTEDKGFCLAWSRSVVDAKIRNSLALLRTYGGGCACADVEMRGLRHSLESLHYATDVNAVIGFEGSAARCYFACLPKLVTQDGFSFKGRSSRPPKDPINSMLSYGYSLFYRNIIGAIERRGLHPYFAFMHKLKLGHAALASDLIEEFRAPLVDRTVLDMVNDEEVTPDDFYETASGAVYLKKDANKRVTARFTEIIAEPRTYFLSTGDMRHYGFQAMLDKKITSVVDAIDHRDAGLYRPCVWTADHE